LSLFDRKFLWFDHFSSIIAWQIKKYYLHSFLYDIG
jgi:hypothetical protein